MFKIKNKYADIRRTIEKSFWPCAIHPNVIFKKEEGFSYARGVVEHIIDEEIAGKRVLNFGFDDYPVSELIHEEYDPEISVRYSFCELKEKSTNTFFSTTDIEKVRLKAPYDIILIYDVIDHIEEDPVGLLKEAKRLLKKNGTIYVRFHPYCSRNALHLHHDLNKAHIHLLFTQEELKKIVPKSKIKFNRGIIYPHLYERYIKSSELKIKFKREILEGRIWPFLMSEEKQSKPRVELKKIFEERKSIITKANKIEDWDLFMFLASKNIEYIDYALVK